MSRTFRHPTWQDEREARESSKRASYLVAIGSTPPASFCLGKTAYPSKNEAREAAKTIRARRGKTMHAYACPRCPAGIHHLATTEL